MKEEVKVVITHPQFTKVGDTLLNADKNALENYKKQKKINRKLLQIEKRLENIEKVLSNGVA